MIFIHCLWLAVWNYQKKCEQVHPKFSRHLARLGHPLLRGRQKTRYRDHFFHCLFANKKIGGNYRIFFFFRRCPKKMGLLPNHPFIDGILSSINHPAVGILPLVLTQQGFSLLQQEGCSRLGCQVKWGCLANQPIPPMSLCNPVSIIIIIIIVIILPLLSLIIKY